MLHGRRPFRRFFCWLSIGMVFLSLNVRLFAASAKTTRITDTVYRADGMPARGTILLSWGVSELSRRANNYFGIKAHGKHGLIEMPTVEVVNGVTLQIMASFAAYDDMKQCFACRDRLILGGAAYADARVATGDPERFAGALAKHWATDPQYAEKLLRVYRENRFDRLDVK